MLEKRFARRRLLPSVGACLLAMLMSGLASPALAEAGDVRVVFTKGGLVVGVGRGKGVLTVRSQEYPFSVSGISVGFTVGASTARLHGQALHLIRPSDIQGTYRLMGAGGAAVAGGGTVKLRNERGVILLLSGGKLGAELSVAVGGVTVTLDRARHDR
jgi:hypothetical protein